MNIYIINNNYIGEQVIITTNIATAANLDGELVEVPLTLKGIVLDADDEAILLDSGASVIAAVMKKHVVSVEIDTGEDEIIEGRPDREDMN